MAQDSLRRWIGPDRGMPLPGKHGGRRHAHGQEYHPELSPVVKARYPYSAGTATVRPVRSGLAEGVSLPSSRARISRAASTSR